MYTECRKVRGAARLGHAHAHVHAHVHVHVMCMQTCGKARGWRRADLGASAVPGERTGWRWMHFLPSPV